jgi:hypothetical protein
MQKADFEDLMPNSIEELGGERLEGSGFEEETPEPSSEWRDPK